MIKLRVDDETAIPLSVDSSSAVSMTVSEAFIDRGGSAIQNNKNATPSTSQVVVTPDQGFDGMAKVTVEAMPQGALSPIDIDFDTNTGAFTAEARVGTSGYLADTEMVGGGFQLDTQAADTITPSTMQRQAVAAHKWTTGAVMVGAIPPEYIIPTGTKSISANGTGIDVKAYEKVDVAVPGITPSGTLAIATNGSHDVTNYATASVAVPASAVDTGTKNITANGNGQDVVGYAAVNVNVPNSYAAADEGKVVQSGALVSQSSATYTENGTYDTTLKNEVVVNVSGGGGGGSSVIASGTFAGNNAYNITVPLGKKMAQTDFVFVMYLPNETEITYVDSGNDVLIANAFVCIPKQISKIDLSQDGTAIKFTDGCIYNVNNEGVITQVIRGGTVAAGLHIRATRGSWGVFGNKTDPESEMVTMSRGSSGFAIKLNRNAWQCRFMSGYTYDWQVIYFGSDPTNDIVEIP